MDEKQLLFGNDVRAPILKGAEKVAKAVIATLGPLGRNVVIRTKAMVPPLITKDGVTVAKSIRAFPDFFEDMGLQMVKEAASRTNDSAGDGTTTATLLAYEMMKEGLNHIQKGSNAIHIRRGMEMARDIVVTHLAKESVEVKSPDQFKAIATISSQDENIGALVALVVQEVGKDGAVTVEPSQALGMDFTLTEGMQLASGFVSPHFINKQNKAVSQMDDPYILLCDERITSLEQILPACDLVATAEGALVVIAESIEADALNALVLNLPWVNVKGRDESKKANFISLAIRAPEIGERRNAVLEDIAVKTGGRVISKKVGLTLRNVTIEDFGRASKVVSTPTTTTIVDADGDEARITARSELIKETIEKSEGDEVDFLKGRLANLTGRIGVIRVGASSELEQKEKQHRVEDAILAVRAAAEEGISPGGGTAYLQCIGILKKKLSNLSGGEAIGLEIVMETLTKPLWWIAENAGHSADEVVMHVKDLKKGFGFNAESGEYVEMIPSNIIDPTKVSRCALQNAVSIAAAFLTLEVGIADLYNSSDYAQ